MFNDHCPYHRLNARQIAKRKALDEARWIEYLEEKRVYEENMAIFIEEYETYNNEMADQVIPIKPPTSRGQVKAKSRPNQSRQTEHLSEDSLSEEEEEAVPSGSKKVSRKSARQRVPPKMPAAVHEPEVILLRQISVCLQTSICLQTCVCLQTAVCLQRYLFTNIFVYNICLLK